MDLDKGGRGAIERMVEAYGFTTRQALCDKLGISKSTLATRYMRDSFPSDWVIQCALETGVSLMWLTTGDGPIYEDAKNDVISIPKKKLQNGCLLDANYWMFDKALHGSILKKCTVIIDDKYTYIVEHHLEDVSDGKWLVEIEGKHSITDILRISLGKVMVGHGNASFHCNINDINFVAKVTITISSNI